MPVVPCSVVIENGHDNFRQCSFRPRVWRDGVPYCRRHDPERARQRALRITRDRLEAARTHLKRLKDDPQEIIRVALEQAESSIRTIEAEIANLEAQAPVEGNR